MKILLLAHRVPFPPDKGEKIRAYHELRSLAEKHTIDLFAFAEQSEENEARRGLRGLCRRIELRQLGHTGAYLRAARNLAAGKPFTTGFFYSKPFAEQVRRALASERYDLIFVYCSAMAQYVPQPAPAPVVIDFVDSDAAKWGQYARVASFPKSWIYKREARIFGDYERKLAAMSAFGIVSTPLEAEAIDPQHRWNLRVLENGVAVPATVELAQVPPGIRSLSPYVVFVGQMDYLPNVDAAEYFAREILPRVRASHPEINFLIVGRNPAPRVRKLATHPGVVVTGAVPEIWPYLESAVAAVAPFRICQGVQNKILEALAIGLPVVSTSRPARAIGATDGETLLVADTPEEFARCVVNLLDDPDARARFARGREFVRRRFDWDTNLDRLERWLCELGGEREMRAGVEQNAAAR